MGHLLKTVNPEAAGAIAGNAPPMPMLGEMVIFRPRMGEQRGGKTEFPAMVLAFPDGAGQPLDLLIFYGADDQIERNRVLRATDHEPLNAWIMHPRNVMFEPFEPSRLNSMAKDLAILKAQVFGEFVDPPKAIMAYLDEFGRRLKTMEKALGVAPKGKPGRPSKK